MCGLCGKSCLQDVADIEAEPDEGEEENDHDDDGRGVGQDGVEPDARSEAEDDEEEGKEHEDFFEFFHDGGLGEKMGTIEGGEEDGGGGDGREWRGERVNRSPQGVICSVSR